MTAYRAPSLKCASSRTNWPASANWPRKFPAYAEATPDLADAILEEAARFAEDVLALNRVGDREGRAFLPAP